MQICFLSPTTEVVEKYILELVQQIVEPSFNIGNLNKFLCQKSTYWVVSCWKCLINNNQGSTQQMKHCGEKFQYIDGCKLYCFVRLRIFAEEATHSKCIKIHITKQDVFKKLKVSRWKDYTGVNWSFTKGWGGTLTLTNLSSILYRWTV